MQACTPAYTSESAQHRIEQGKKEFPKDPSQYRHVNPAMDKELIAYREEIENRFNRGDTKDFVMPRIKEQKKSQNIIGTPPVVI